MICFMLFVFSCYCGNEYITNSKQSTILATIDWIQLICIQIVYFVSIIGSLKSSGEEHELLQQITIIDNILIKSLNYDIEHGRYLKSVLRNSIILIVTIILSQIIAIVVFVLGERSNAAMLLTYWVLYIIPLVGSVFKCIQFVSYVFLLKNRFDKVNCCLLNVNLVNDEYKVHKTKGYILALNSFNLIIIRDLYGRLCESVELLNRWFGISILMNIGNGFVFLTMSFYSAFLIIRELEDSRNIVITIVLSATWSTPYLLYIFIICVICHLLIRSVRF